MANPNYDKLIKLLAELFQYDRADLDFGIYRIMNQKREEISSFLETDLLPQVRSALEGLQSTDRTQIEAELHKAIEAAKGIGVDPESSPKVQELRQKYNATSDPAELEGSIYSDLYNFFRRYYTDGDFISLRRYKEGVYAIPYEGEEVKLHWANADQYYVKSSENFRDYAFTLPDGRRVQFRIVDADTERDNTKAQAGKERRFVFSKHEPIAEDSGELVIPFHYGPHGEKQPALNDKAIEAILSAAPAEWRAALETPAPTEKSPKRTLLAKHLTAYTARNSFDYFIHKDLGGFLRRELDFFIKNEIVVLDDIVNESVPRVEQYLGRVRVMKMIAHKIIDFLAQLEDFQKRLWLKKKFVVDCGYCVTLDRVPEELYPEIATNDAQREEWIRLFAIDEIAGDTVTLPYSTPLTVEFLKSHPHLVLDTKFFPTEFTDRLLASFDGLDAQLDGLIVHSENFQALNFLMERYREQVKCVYIDPPYNTGDGDFPYKDAYQHSSWLSLLVDRLQLTRMLQTTEGTITVSIDDVEVHRLNEALRHVYGDQELAQLVWDRNRKNDARFFSVGHEYMTVFARDLESLRESGVSFREPKEGIDSARKYYERLCADHGEDWEVIREGWLKWFDTILPADPRRRMIRFSKVGPRGPYRDDGDISWPGGGGPKYEVLHPETGRPCKVPRGGWVYSTPERFWEEVGVGRVVFGPDETTLPRQARYLFDGEGQVMPSVFYSYAQVATLDFNALFGARAFDNPKNWLDIARVVRYLGSSDSHILDFFAGSGTTAHAVINLNREDNGRRKYILVEMGEYFDTVLKSRVQKVIYSKDWKDGKPVSRQGSSHMFKYLRLETYEDTLNNLSLRRTEAQTSLLDQYQTMREDYTLRYMLDIESRQSLLGTERFRNPFAYTLKVATDSAGETRPVTVDLVETFNYLLGLRVRHTETIRGIRVVQGVNPTGDRVLVIWRNLDTVSNEDLDDFFRKQQYNPRDLEFDLIYVNGDNNLENLRREDETWKVRLVEEEFARRMFG